MKISLLLERENFKTIFKKTLEGFLEDFTKEKHQVCWYSKSEKITEKGHQIWYCNPLINSIFVAGAKENIFDPITEEYSHNPLKPWRSQLQKLYLYFSKNKYLSIYMSKYIITVSPKIKNGENILIIGGNTKIRMIDRTSKRVYTILKSGFKNSYIHKELYVRSSFPYLPLTKISQVGKSKSWFCEEYISGIPPDRMEKINGHKVLHNAIDSINKMLIETKKTEYLSSYVNRLKIQILNSLNEIDHITPKSKSRIKEIIINLKRYLKKDFDTLIKISYCHGDFQQGNVIFDGEKTWIIDWEYSGYRQIGYDLFVLLLKSRVAAGFSKRFLKFIINQLNRSQIDVLSKWTEIKDFNSKERNTYLFVFLFEELSLHIEENSNITFKRMSAGLESIIFSIESILDELKFTSNEIIELHNQ
mgnify:CR=1 FL=1